MVFMGVGMGTIKFTHRLPVSLLNEKKAQCFFGKHLLKKV
jgi:hypothetical protein